MYNFLSQVQISPDGKKVAYVATTPDLAKNGYNANLYRIDAESGENACLTNSGRVKGFCWQGAETLLYTVPVASALNGAQCPSCDTSLSPCGL